MKEETKKKAKEQSKGAAIGGVIVSLVVVLFNFMPEAQEEVTKKAVVPLVKAYCQAQSHERQVWDETFMTDYGSMVINCKEEEN